MRRPFYEQAIEFSPSWDRQHKAASFASPSAPVQAQHQYYDRSSVVTPYQYGRPSSGYGFDMGSANDRRSKLRERRMQELQKYMGK